MSFLGPADPSRAYVEVRQHAPAQQHKPLLCAGTIASLDAQGCFGLLAGLCAPPCGNGRLEVVNGFNEECDDGNTVPGDGCSGTCEIEVQGLFALAVSATGAVANPARELFALLEEPLCGDGVTQAPWEACDGPSGCSDGCTRLDPGCLVHPVTRRVVCLPSPAVCGDGVLDPHGELCDDGNAAAGDGCSPACSPEARDVCGDGVVGPTEVCEPTLEPLCAADCTAVISRLPLAPLRIFAGGAFDDPQLGVALDDHVRNTAQFTVLFSDGVTLKTFGANADSAAGLGTNEPLGATAAGMGDQLPPVHLNLPAGSKVSQLCMISNVASPGSAAPAASVTTCLLASPQGLVKCFGSLAEDKDPYDSVQGWSCPAPAPRGSRGSAPRPTPRRCSTLASSASSAPQTGSWCG